MKWFKVQLKDRNIYSTWISADGETLPEGPRAQITELTWKTENRFHADVWERIDSEFKYCNIFDGMSMALDWVAEVFKKIEGK
ncbi:hypothetical protein [Fibrobacter sp. UWH4]|uniref:hypothetical protein n=1 Tax=Fibrobacter sp. UWH4 TaxID=1896210 RepID=UPI000920AB1E|nr:hypothetical protein [Fibrobacter sp. UWH4]SHL06450.1 hypothetical protein SAMN05720762_10493 [Fibrobacter sp. UWH4]